MKFKVINKHNNSKNCVVCGLSNPFSFRTRYFGVEGNMLVGITTPREEHQSYPGRMHGGMTATLLDETVGRSAQVLDPDLWAVTGDLNIRYKKPIDLNKPLKVVGKLIKDGSRTFIAAGFIEDGEGNILATGQATYIKLTVDKIVEGGMPEEEWYLNPEADDPKEIEIINYKYFDSLTV